MVVVVAKNECVNSAIHLLAFIYFNGFGQFFFEWVDTFSAHLKLNFPSSNEHIFMRFAYIMCNYFKLQLLRKSLEI